MTHIDIVFAKSPDPNPDFRFVEVEDASGASIDFGEWVERPDKYWALRIDSMQVFSLADRVPEVGQYVAVISEGWCAPKILQYSVFPYQRLIDRDSGRWFWYPERMRWQALSNSLRGPVPSEAKP